jgi:xanthine dehydrogenase accessory factor
MPVPHGFVEKLAELSAAGRAFVAVTLVETVGSTPQDTGTKMLVDPSGLVFGTVGGGRVENKSIGHAQSLLSDHGSGAAQTCQLVEWNLQRDVGMTCGGVVKLLFEAYNFHEWRIVVFGAGHVAQSLVRLLGLLECRVTCVDQRDDWLAKLPTSPKLRVIQLAEPRDFVAQLQGDEFVVCMTMGHKTDRPILQAILQRNLPLLRGEGRGEGGEKAEGGRGKAETAAVAIENLPSLPQEGLGHRDSPPPHPNPLPKGEGTGGFQLPYLGVIGSQAKRKVLVRELIEGGLADELANAFRCPIGLPLGTNQPGEIAVSIAAELIQCRDALGAKI